MMDFALGLVIGLLVGFVIGAITMAYRIGLGVLMMVETVAHARKTGKL